MNQPFACSEGLITQAQVSEMLHLHPGVLCNWRVQGRGPIYIKVGRKVLYRLQDVESWIEGQRIEPEKKREAMAVQIPRARSVGRSKHRLGGYRTKSQKSAPDGSRPSAGSSGGTLGNPPIGGSLVQ
jgi:hypothetical protein